VLFWKRADRWGFRPPTAVATLDLLSNVVVLALVVDVIVVASESCFRVLIDLKKISIFLDCCIFLNYHYIFLIRKKT
jgi:hypothetical protein